MIRKILRKDGEIDSEPHVSLKYIHNFSGLTLETRKNYEL
jgi:hypothetical protein